jgi:glycosyltransferase involved in cell wall biosynthesis
MSEITKNLSIVLPCFNPPIGWEKVVVESMSSLNKKVGQEIELIIVNDGSFKNTGTKHFDFVSDMIRNVKIVQHKENKGKGQALRTGVSVAKGDLIIFTDIDFPYTEDSFLRIYNSLLSGNQIALGHRNKAYYQHTPTGRKLISKVLRFSLKTFLRLPTDDSQCGIKGFDASGRAVFLSTTIDRFLFDLEFIKLVSKKKLSSENVEVELKPGVVFSKVNVKILAKESLNFAKILFKR